MSTLTDYPELMNVEGNQERLSELHEMTTHLGSLDLYLELRISKERYLSLKEAAQIDPKPEQLNLRPEVKDESDDVDTE